MIANTDVYENPLITRYGSKEMNAVFSPRFKFVWWRKLWLFLAETQKELGLNISEEQLDEMRRNLENIDFDYAESKEREFRHDVMGHVHAFAKVAPKAAPIIHLGATSAFVGDNTDLIQMREGLKIVRQKLLGVVDSLKNFALKYKDLPTLAYTHFQPAQPTTVGKRACLWIQDLLLDLDEITFCLDNLPFRGVKGTTGTQASFLELFDGDHQKVKALNEGVCGKAGFQKFLHITGQTYSRKLDARVLRALSSVSESASKFATDLRLLSHKKEMEEPFEKKQIGSSAMAYKRNPMRSERICSLARFVMSLSFSTAYTASTQWFERTLDDSANKRLSVPQAFLAVDAILDVYANVAGGMVVYEKIVEKNLREELPFMITEHVLMACVKKGGDRQKLHEVIRRLSVEAGRAVKQEGKLNPLVEMLASSEDIPMTKEEIESLLTPSRHVGRSKEITEEFIEEEVLPRLKGYQGATFSDLKV